jgi:hypothetical protein
LDRILGCFFVLRRRLMGDAHDENHRDRDEIPPKFESGHAFTDPGVRVAHE